MKVNSGFVFVFFISFFSTCFADNYGRPILAFEEKSIPVYDANGNYIKDIEATVLGEPSKVIVKGRLDNGLLIVQKDGADIFIDSSFVKLIDGFEPVKISVTCLDKIRNKPSDTKYLTSLGIGNC